MIVWSKPYSIEPGKREGTIETIVWNGRRYVRAGGYDGWWYASVEGGAVKPLPVMIWAEAWAIVNDMPPGSGTRSCVATKRGVEPFLVDACVSQAYWKMKGVGVEL